jgi:antitoxin component YwqK of YwqJK toxin-antitoxin module
MTSKIYTHEIISEDYYVGLVTNTKEYSNNILKTHYYKNEKNEFIGKYTKYFENGKLKIESFYKNNKLEGTYKQYYQDGELKIECFYKNNNLEGTYKTYYENGKLRELYFFKDHTKQGIGKSYYPDNNELEYQCFYKNNLPDGLFKYLCKQHGITTFAYYIHDNGKGQVKDLFFKNIFALLKFKDILKTRYRRPIYLEIDKFFIQDISDIIGSYLFTVSKFNPNRLPPAHAFRTYHSFNLL